MDILRPEIPAFRADEDGVDGFGVALGKLQLSRFGELFVFSDADDQRVASRDGGFGAAADGRTGSSRSILRSRSLGVAGLGVWAKDCRPARDTGEVPSNFIELPVREMKLVDKRRLQRRSRRNNRRVLFPNEYEIIRLLSSFFAACGPAEVSRQAPRALNSVSSQRGVMFAGGIEGAGGASDGPIQQAKPSRPRRHTRRDHPRGKRPLAVGTTYSRFATIRLFDPVSTRGNRRELVDDVL